MKSMTAALFGAAILTTAASASTFTVGLFTNATSPTPFGRSEASTSVSGGPESAVGYAGSFVGIKGSAGSAGGDINAFAASSGFADSLITDVTFSGPGSFVTATVTLPFTSLQTGEFWLTPFGNSGTSGTLTFGLTFNQYAGSIGLGYTGDDAPGSDPSCLSAVGCNLGISGSGWSYSLVSTIGPPVLSSCGDPASAVCAHWSVSYQLNGSVSFTELFPVGTPLLVHMSVQGGCSAGGLFPADCQYDALDPFGLIPGFASFDLPDGYTVNAESVGLVNGVIPGGTVPEPGPAVLMAAGMALIVGLRRVVKA